MRLLNVDSRRLHTFYDDAIPRYAILSHTWDQNEPEVTFDDLKRPDHAMMARYDKIEHTCRLAEERRLEWVWIDTCCIDKSSSAELSEAINSMFRYYEKSAVCFVHLEDVEKQDAVADPDAAFKWPKGRWFSRGWTLQELIAPDSLEFYDKAWKLVGDRSSLSEHIHHRTGIPTEYLRKNRIDFRQARIGERMSWAADRETTRKEDIAYSLFGLFDVNMPLLYGEGERAFRRLQEEIIKTSTDDSIFAWSSNE
ncbi:heterokaryon incompatibility protein-domain-containing protein, partial [Cercophora newfieldiana]